MPSSTFVIQEYRKLNSLTLPHVYTMSLCLYQKSKSIPCVQRFRKNLRDCARFQGLFFSSFYWHLTAQKLKRGPILVFEGFRVGGVGGRGGEGGRRRGRRGEKGEKGGGGRGKEKWGGGKCTFWSKVFI